MLAGKKGDYQQKYTRMNVLIFSKPPFPFLLYSELSSCLHSHMKDLARPNLRTSSDQGSSNRDSKKETSMDPRTKQGMKKRIDANLPHALQL